MSFNPAEPLAFMFSSPNLLFGVLSHPIILLMSLIMSSMSPSNMSLLFPASPLVSGSLNLLGETEVSLLLLVPYWDFKLAHLLHAHGNGHPFTHSETM